jgi:rare lipoprotein A
LGLSVLLFCVSDAAQNNNIARENILTEERVVSPQADAVVTQEVAAVETNNAHIQEVSDNNAAAKERRVVRRYSAKASWYRHGRVTANGEQYNPLGLTVAHRSLPFGTIVRFTNPDNGQSVTVRVNDRGPYIRGREFDLSLGSARALGFESRGVMVLRVEIM